MTMKGKSDKQDVRDGVSAWWRNVERRGAIPIDGGFLISKLVNVKN